MPDLTHRRKGSRRREIGGSLEFPAGAILFDSHRACRRVYLLRSGQVQLKGERGAIVDYLSSGDFFGEKSLLNSNSGGLEAKSLSPIEVFAFRKSEVLKRVQEDRRFAARLLKSLARRLDRYEQTIQDSVVEHAERRLALLLCRFLPARPASGWVRLRFSPSNSELARTIGSTRWRVAHFMRRFQGLGWLERRPDLWVLRERLGGFLELTARKA
jgi:CRP/FNR family transcriptional regulator, cyclic AMP receptor protein